MGMPAFCRSFFFGPNILLQLQEGEESLFLMFWSMGRKSFQFLPLANNWAGPTRFLLDWAQRRAHAKVGCSTPVTFYSLLSRTEKTILCGLCTALSISYETCIVRVSEKKYIENEAHVWWWLCISCCFILTSCIQSKDLKLIQTKKFLICS